MPRRRSPRPSRRVQAAVAVLVVLVLLVRGLAAGVRDDERASSGAPRPPAAREETGVSERTVPGSRGGVGVLSAIDGDTLEVRLGGRARRVRLLGIDAPESTTLRSGHVECGGEAAKAFAEALVARHPRVDLVSDPTQDEEDRYGRLLAYVRPAGSGGPTFQEQVLRAGLARVYVYGRPFRQVDAFRAAAAAAERARAGVWARCGGDFRRPLR